MSSEKALIGKNNENNPENQIVLESINEIRDNDIKKQILLKTKNKRITVKYSNRFKSYNAIIRYNSKEIIFSLSKKWQEISKPIKIGLIQLLLFKLFKIKYETNNIKLYQNFIRNLSKYSLSSLESEKNENSDSSNKRSNSNKKNIEGHREERPLELEESFKRVNQKFFNNYLDRPFLRFGTYSFTVLGNYNYHTDTITISRIFKNISEKNKLLLDYVMYHELLHKKLGFTSKGTRNLYHSSKFRMEEKKFEQYFINEQEKEIIRENRETNESTNNENNSKEKHSNYLKSLFHITKKINRKEDNNLNSNNVNKIKNNTHKRTVKLNEALKEFIKEKRRNIRRA